jgi:hypothetical protein
VMAKALTVGLVWFAIAALCGGFWLLLIHCAFNGDLL